MKTSYSLFLAVVMTVPLACSEDQLEAQTKIQSPQQFEHVGVASIIDGDTLDIREQRYRFDGVDTPESGSWCGTTNVYQKASLALADLTQNRNVTCEPNGNKNYDRLIATCFVSIGDSRVNLSQRLVEEGWARDWPRYSKGKYAGAEREARSKKLGVWGLSCPEDLWGTRNYE